MDFQVTVYDSKDTNKEKSVIPYPLRCVIFGSSGYVFSTSLEQEAYKKLQDRYKDIDKEIAQKISYFYSNCEDLNNVDECSSDLTVIFDNCLVENQDIIKSILLEDNIRIFSALFESVLFYGRFESDRNN